MALTLGTGSMGPREKKIAAGVGMVVAIALTLLVWSIFKGESLHEGWEKHHFICQDCGEHFVIDHDKLPPKYLEGISKSQAVFVDCPKCGKKGTGSPAIKCHNTECGKWYAKYRKTEDGGVKQTPNCPYCGTNPMEWDRKHKGKGKRS